MALDIAILGPDGAVSEYVPLGMEGHWELLKKAKELNLRIIQKMDDYYDDFSIEHAEIDAFLNELGIISKENFVEKGLNGKVRQIIDLALKAKRRGVGIEGIAD